MMLVPLSAMRGKIGMSDVARNLTLVLIGNLLGALFVAFFLAVQTGVIGGADAAASSPEGLTHARLATIAEGKAIGESPWQIFLRAVGCNWLVCLAVWMSMAATSVSGKILAIFFPIMAFVAMGFDHVVANMFFLPAAMFAGVPDITWGNTLVNWLLAGIGNLVGAVIFVATSYWYLFLKDRPDEADATEKSPRDRGEPLDDQAPVIRQPPGQSRTIEVLQQREYDASAGAQPRPRLAGRERLGQRTQLLDRAYVGTGQQHDARRQPEQPARLRCGCRPGRVETELAEPVGGGRAERVRRQVVGKGRKGLLELCREGVVIGREHPTAVQMQRLSQHRRHQLG